MNGLVVLLLLFACQSSIAQAPAPETVPIPLTLAVDLLKEFKLLREANAELAADNQAIREENAELREVAAKWKARGDCS